MTATVETLEAMERPPVSMIFAAGGYLVPVAGAITQEIIDVLAVLNALRAAFPPKVISDIAEDLTKPSGRVVE